MQFINKDINLSMHNSSIEVDESAIISLEENITLTNTNITIHQNANFSIGAFSEIRGRIIVQPASSLWIGKNLVCNSAIFIHSSEQGNITIGNDCLFSNTQIYNSDFHAYYDDETGIRINQPKDIKIGNHVWLGLNSLILKGTFISDNSIVGAGAITSKIFDIPNSVITGNPAKIVKQNISWSRKIYETKPSLEFVDRAYFDEFIHNAQQLNHNKVINMGIRYYPEWKIMNSNNYHFFYYLCRSILMSRIAQFKEKGFIKYDIFNITLHDLFEIFSKGYFLSNKKNYACGAYVHKTAIMLRMDTIASELYTEIYPKWPHIKDEFYSQD